MLPALVKSYDVQDRIREDTPGFRTASKLVRFLKHTTQAGAQIITPFENVGSLSGQNLSAPNVAPNRHSHTRTEAALHLARVALQDFWQLDNSVAVHLWP